MASKNKICGPRKFGIDCSTKLYPAGNVVAGDTIFEANAGRSSVVIFDPAILGINFGPETAYDSFGQLPFTTNGQTRVEFEYEKYGDVVCDKWVWNATFFGSVWVLEVIWG